MAKKRLNKKVAIIGSMILALLGFAIIWTLLQLSKDPSKFLTDAEAAIAQNNYKEAEQNYGKAYECAKDDELKIDIVFKLADLHLVNNQFHEPNWRKAMGCWYNIINIDPKNIQARKSVLDYYYQAADSGNNRIWKTIETNASELTDVMREKNIEPDPNIQLIKGRATLEITSLGQTTDREKSITDAITDLSGARQMLPENPDVYLYLAQAQLLKGTIETDKGILDAQQKAADNAAEILQEAVDAAPDNPRAYINLLNMKLVNAIGDRAGRQEAEALKDEFEAMAKKFSSSAAAYVALSKFHHLRGNTDESIEAISKAIELDSENVNYIITAIEQYYRKASIRKDKESLNRAIEMATGALELPDAQDVPGPRQSAKIRNRYTLFTFLSTCYIELALETRQNGDLQQNQHWVKLAQDTIHQIEQIIGTGDNVKVIKWRGMLALAKGDKTAGIRQMYNAYQQLKATDQLDPTLFHTLAEACKDYDEIGTRMQFLSSALDRRMSMAVNKPQVWLQFAEAAMKLRNYNHAIAAVNSYELSYPQTERSRQIRIKAYIGAGQFDQAREGLAEIEPDSFAAIELDIDLTMAQMRRLFSTQATTGLSAEESEQLENFKNQVNQLVGKLLDAEPEELDFSIVRTTCYVHIENNNKEQAGKLVDKYLARWPENTDAVIYKRMLSEPDPLNITAERSTQIAEDALGDIADDMQRAIALGKHYQAIGAPQKAMTEFKTACQIDPDDNTATELLFGAALASEDIESAEQLVQKARQENIDQCQGNFFAARLEFARKNYQNALERINECLEKWRPVFSRGYLLRSRINIELEKDDEAIEDARTAADMNPLDGLSTWHLASLLHNRSLKLGSTVSSEQQADTERTLLRAIAANPGQWDIQGTYADYISNREPEKALAIRQNLQRTFRNTRNSVMLGNMALQMGLKTLDAKRKEALLEIAGSAYEDAYKIGPQDRAVLDAYSEYLRITGRQEKAADLLAGSKEVLWKFHFRNGQFEKCKETLLQLHQQEPANLDIVKGLIAVAQKTADKQAVQKYSQQLLDIDNTEDNQLLQIQVFLETGLIQQAELKLASFRERNPDHPKGMQLEAWTVMAKGQLKKALELINRSLEADSQSATTWRLRGQVNGLLGNLDQAIEDMQKSRVINPGFETRVELARAYNRADRITEAIAELTAALKEGPAPLSVANMLEELYMKTARKSDLEKFYREIIARYPDSQAWYSRAGNFHLKVKQYEQAEKLMEKSWQLSRKTGPDLAAFDGYLRVLEARGKYEELLKLTSEHIDTALAPIAYLHMAYTQLKMGQKQTATGYYHKALEKAESKEQLVLDILQNMLTSLGPDETEKWCRDKLKAEPDSLVANMAIFNISSMNGDYNKARGYIEKCIEIVGPQSELAGSFAINKASLLVAGYSKTADRQYLTDAISEFEKILTNQPNNVEIMNNVAYLLADNNQDIDKAIEYAKRAHERSPNSPNTMDTYAYTLCKTGDFTKALQLLQMAIQLFERDSTSVPWEVHNHLGMAQEGLGFNTEAAASYKKAILLGGEKISDRYKQNLRTSIERVSQ